jgi:hypothetical protein
VIRNLRRISKHKYFHFYCFALLIVLWSPMAFFGFHPHHEGLMLATLNLTSDAIKTGGSYPFNQYGPFWTLPYLTMNLIPLSGFTFLAQRFVSILMIFFSAIIIRRISLKFYSHNTSLLISCLFLLTYPYGQPSIIWPSIPAQLALLILTHSVLLCLDFPHRIYVFIASLATIFLLGSRIQIGILSILCTIVILAISRHFLALARYVIYTTLCLGFVVLIFLRLDLFEDVLFDSLVFPLTYLDSNQQNWTFPRTSLAVMIALIILFLFLNKIRDNRNIIGVPLIIMLTVSTGLLFLHFHSQETYLQVYARIYVGFFLFVASAVFLLTVRNLRQFKTNFPHPGVLWLYCLVGATQVFPLFDAFHAWYASAPLIIALPLIFRDTNLVSKLSRNTIVVWVSSLVFALFTFFSLQTMQSFANTTKPFPLDEVKGIFLTTQQVSDFQNEFTFLKNNIPKRSTIMNFCSNADPFFPRGYWPSASRLFVFWPGFSDSPLIEKDLLKADFVTSCTSITALSDTSQRILEENFSKVGTRLEKSSWGLDWEIYKKNTN